MATLTYNVTSGSWSASITVNYTSSYNPSTNQTTFTFGECTYSYPGKTGYNTTIYTEVWVSADWDSTTARSTTLSISGTTNTAGKTYTGTPSPSTLTVQHASTAGAKIGCISSYTKIGVYPWSTSTDLYYYSNEDDAASDYFTSTTLYTFHKNVSVGALEETYNSVVYGSRTDVQNALADGDLIPYGSTLQLWWNAEDGYTITAAHFGGGGIVDKGATHTVTGDITVTVTAEVNSYSLSISPSTGSNIVVNRTSSPLKGAETGELENEATIYYNDVLTITFVALPGYELLTTTVNGSDFTSEDTYTVTSAVIVETTTKQLGLVYIDNGSGFKAYLVYIDNGTVWDQYAPYIDNGTSWDLFS